MKTFFFICFLFAFHGLKAQQTPLFSSSLQAPHLKNFALAGTNDVAQLDLISRFQWIGYGQGPATLFANGFVTLGKDKGHFSPSSSQLFQSPDRRMGTYKHVIGGNIYHDRIGLLNTTSVKFAYAIHLPISSTWSFSASLSAGYGNVFLNFNEARVKDKTDEIYNDGHNANQSVFQTSAGLGIYNQNFTFGFGVDQMIRNKTKFADLSERGAFNPHFYTNASYAFNLGKISLIPQVAFRFSEHVRSSLDFGVQLQYNRAFWFGLYGRTSNAFMAQIGANLFKQAYIAYAFEAPVVGLARMATTSHELRLGIYLKKKDKSIQHQKAEEREESSPSNANE